MKQTRRQREDAAFKKATDWVKEEYAVPLTKVAALINPDEKVANNRINNIRGGRIDLDLAEMVAIEAGYPGFLAQYNAALSGEQPGSSSRAELTSIKERLENFAGEIALTMQQTIAAQAQTIEALKQQVELLTKQLSELSKK
jgi:hypothetical protein